MEKHLKIFVTVGTTSFDKLIQTVCDPSVLEIMKVNQYTKLTLQIGRGTYEPSVATGSAGVGVEVNFFRYKDSISSDIYDADLVISHAGAGSCMEVLAANKPLLVVINEDLMDNHQIELASQLHQDGHLLYCTCRTLPETLRTMDLSTLHPFPRGQPEKFAMFLDQLMGL